MGGINETERFQQGVERAFLAQDLLHSDGADKRRQDHGNEHERGEKALAGKKVPVGQQGKGKRDGRGEDGAVDRHLHGVPKSLQINGVAENLEEVVEGKAAARLAESPSQRFPDGQEEEEEKEKRSEREDDMGAGEGEATRRRGDGVTRRGIGPGVSVSPCLRVSLHLPSFASWAARRY